MSSPSSTSGARSASGPTCRRSPTADRRSTADGSPLQDSLMATARSAAAAAEKRRLILDAAVRVFARQGFHTCRVSDIADEAGVAYGLVYHYFQSKDQILDTLFLERWEGLLRALRETDAQDIPAEEKLGAIADFLVQSY